jgi:hypothetical protein
VDEHAKRRTVCTPGGQVSSANIAYCLPDDSIQRFRYCGGNDTPAKTDGVASLTA